MTRYTPGKASKYSLRIGIKKVHYFNWDLLITKFTFIIE